MTRRGVTYRIERNADGTFGRFVPTGRSASAKSSSKGGKKASTRKASAKTASRGGSKSKGRSTSRRASR